jgi:hypothetical protein
MSSSYAEFVFTGCANPACAAFDRDRRIVVLPHLITDGIGQRPDPICLRCGLELERVDDP